MGAPNLPRRLGAEALGTFVLVAAGTGAVTVDAVSPGRIGHGGVAAAFGLAVATMIFAVGHLSGAHLNPAVTLAFAAARHFPGREVAPYMAAQVAGALLASLALRGLFGTAGGLGATHPDHVGAVAALLVEVALTAVLVAVIFAVATDTRRRGAPAVAVGGVIALEALVMGPITGASMNPARSLSPALVGADLADLWLYMVGPVTGGLVGAGLYQALRGDRAPVGGLPDAAPGPAAERASTPKEDATWR